MAHAICEQIPQIQLDILSRTLLSAMERFYSEPENLRRFEEWLRSEEGQVYSQRNNAQKTGASLPNLKMNKRD